jgi:putative nucleotidyltransferase with HDIG domain
MINREDALVLLNKHLNNKNTIKHCLATAIVMEALAEKFGEDTEVYYLTGLLHDIDLDTIGDDFEKHALLAIDLLEEAELTTEMKNAILAHNSHKPLETMIEKCLWIADPVNGLVVASGLMQPDKKLEQVKLRSLKKKFKSKNFAAGASREQMSYCEEMGIELIDFLELSLTAMTAKAEVLGM